MIIGTVIGTVVCTRKHELLTGSKFLIVRPMDKMNGVFKRLVAVDNVGAGVGDIVLVATGGAARAGLMSGNTLACAPPVDALIIGIVDDASKIVINEK